MSPGDVVRLKSGGPPMTILEIRGETVATVEWFIDGKLRSSVFRLSCLDMLERKCGMWLRKLP